VLHEPWQASWSVASQQLTVTALPALHAAFAILLNFLRSHLIYSRGTTQPSKPAQTNTKYRHQSTTPKTMDVLQKVLPRSNCSLLADTRSAATVNQDGHWMVHNHTQPGCRTGSTSTYPNPRLLPYNHQQPAGCFLNQATATDSRNTRHHSTQLPHNTHLKKMKSRWLWNVATRRPLN
jgi:hypothetical protein